MNLKEADAVAQEINDLFAPETPEEVGSVLSVRDQ
jgi:hypothetical protein